MHWQRFAVEGCSVAGVRHTVDERGADSLQATGLVAKMTVIDYFRYLYTDVFLVSMTILFMLVVSWVIRVSFENKAATPLKVL